MPLHDCRGVPVSCGDQGLIDRLDRLHEDVMASQGTPLAEINEIPSAHPDFVMGHCFKAALLTQTMEVRIYDPMRASVRAAEALAERAKERERGRIAPGRPILSTRNAE